MFIKFMTMISILCFFFRFGFPSSLRGKKKKISRCTMGQRGAAEGHDNHPSIGCVFLPKKGYHKTLLHGGPIMRWPMQHTCKPASPIEIAYAET